MALRGVPATITALPVDAPVGSAAATAAAAAWAGASVNDTGGTGQKSVLRLPQPRWVGAVMMPASLPSSGLVGISGRWIMSRSARAASRTGASATSVFSPMRGPFSRNWAIASSSAVLPARSPIPHSVA